MVGKHKFIFCAVSSGFLLQAYMIYMYARLCSLVWVFGARTHDICNQYTDHVYCQCVKDYDMLLSSQNSNLFILIDCSTLRKL